MLPCASVLPVQLDCLPFPELPPDLSPSRFWFPAFDSIWNVLSPSVEILPLQGPCPNASSTRKPPPSGSAFWKRLYPLPSVTARVCARLSPWPGCRCRKGGDDHTPLCLFLPRLSLGVGWRRLVWRSPTLFLNATEFVPVPGQGGQPQREILSAHAPS